MKRLLTIFLLSLSFAAYAQDEEFPQLNANVRDRIYAARAAYITERLSLTSDQAEKFWPVYNEFTEKRIDLRRQYHRAKRGGRDEKELIDLDLKIKQQQLDLEKDYSERLLKVISPQQLVNLKKAEMDFRKLLLRQIEQRRGGRNGKQLQQGDN